MHLKYEFYHRNERIHQMWIDGSDTEVKKLTDQKRKELAVERKTTPDAIEIKCTTKEGKVIIL